jgi:hypothetical protein
LGNALGCDLVFPWWLISPITGRAP